MRARARDVWRLLEDLIRRPPSLSADGLLRLAVLVDTSVWINHFRKPLPDLEHLLHLGQVSTHPMVLGELACGSLRQRVEVLSLLGALPSVVTATHEEVLHFIDQHALHGSGLGLIDVHLLAAARLSRQSLWTADRRLRSAALRLNLAGPE